MNASKIMWVLVGFLSIGVLGMVGYVVVRDDARKTQTIQQVITSEKNTSAPTFSIGEQNSQTTVVDWKKEWEQLLPGQKVIETKDITGDGKDEALAIFQVTANGEGASGVSEIAIAAYTIKNQKPVRMMLTEKGVKKDILFYNNTAMIGSKQVSFGLTSIEQRTGNYGSGGFKVTESSEYVWNKNLETLIFSSGYNPNTPNTFPSLTDQILKGTFNFKPAGYDETFTIVNGDYFRRQNPVIQIKFSEPLAVGDLNGDGIKDLAIPYYVSTGGNGGYTYIAVFLDVNNKPKYIGNINNNALGDSVNLKLLSITDGILNVEWADFPAENLFSEKHRVVNSLLQKVQ